MRGRSLPPLLLLALAGALGAPAGAAANLGPATTPTILDATDPIDTAVAGDAAAWLRPTGRSSARLVWWTSAGGRATLSPARLQSRPTRVTVGSDATGHRAAIVEFRGHPARIYRLTGRGSGRVLPVARLRGPAPHDFGLWRGRISFATKARVRGRLRDVIRIGTATSSRSRIVVRNPGLTRRPETAKVVDTALGADGRVAFTAFASDDGLREAVPAVLGATYSAPLPFNVALYGDMGGGGASGSRLMFVDRGRHVAITVSGESGDDNGTSVQDADRSYDDGSARTLREGDLGVYWSAVPGAADRGRPSYASAPFPLDDGSWIEPCAVVGTRRCAGVAHLTPDPSLPRP